jgi:hypothetical protein
MILHMVIFKRHQSAEWERGIFIEPSDIIIDKDGRDVKVYYQYKHEITLIDMDPFFEQKIKPLSGW